MKLRKVGARWQFSSRVVRPFVKPDLGDLQVDVDSEPGH